MRQASCASTASPSIRSSVARPWPTMRGSRWIAPISAPARPTLTKRNAKRAGVGGDAVDRGDDRLFQRAHVLDHVAGYARKAVQRLGLHLDELGDDLLKT